MIEFNILQDDEKCYGINHVIKYEYLAKLEEEMGYRILMTNNHTWGICEIIQAYHGQSFIENTLIKYAVLGAALSKGKHSGRMKASSPMLIILQAGKL